MYVLSSFAILFVSNFHIQVGCRSSNQESVMKVFVHDITNKLSSTDTSRSGLPEAKLLKPQPPPAPKKVAKEPRNPGSLKTLKRTLRADLAHFANTKTSRGPIGNAIRHVTKAITIALYYREAFAGRRGKSLTNPSKMPK